MLAMHDLAWTAGALCSDLPSEMFYRQTGSNVPPDVRNCCNLCQVRRHCLAYAIANDEVQGVWGGASRNERRDLATTRCPSCRRLLGRRTVAAMVDEATQHIRCPTCQSWCEVVPPWDRPHRNSWITGTGRRT